jgi:hypothetical protein
VKVYKLKRSFFEEYSNKLNGLVTLWKNAIKNFPRKDIPIDDYTTYKHGHKKKAETKLHKKKTII